MKKLLFITPTLVLFFFFSGCKRSSEPADNTTSQTDKILTTSVLSDTRADSLLLLTSDPYQNFLSADAYFKSLPEVESTSLQSDMYIVRIKNGGDLIYSWASFKGDKKDLFYELHPQKGHKSVMTIYPDYAHVLITNQVSEDEQYSYLSGYVNATKSAFESIGATVTVINHDQLTVDYIQNNLKTNDIVFYIGHGSYDITRNRTWILTGETGTRFDLILHHLQSYLDGQLNLINVVIHVNGKKETRHYYCFSNRFVDNTISNQGFNNKIFYTVACHSMQDPDYGMAKAFVNKGTKVFFGWSEAESGGDRTGMVFLTELCTGRSISGSLSSMDPAYLVSTTPYNQQNQYAHLVEYPDNAATGNIQINDLQPGQWTVKSPIPTARIYLGSACVNHIIYVLGGGTPGNGVSNLNEAYDPVSNMWLTMAPLPATLGFFNALAYNNKIYVIGGWDGTYQTAQTLVYDPQINSWETKTSMPTIRSNAELCEVNGKIFAIGGWQWGSVARNENEMYDPATDTWTSKAPMATSRGYFIAEAVNNKIYAIGGGVTGVAVECYDPASDSWSTKADSPYPVSAMASGVSNNEIYIFGGQTLTGFNDKVLIYNPASDTWRTGASLLTMRNMLTATFCDNIFYVLGGADASGNALNNNEAYLP